MTNKYHFHDLSISDAQLEPQTQKERTAVASSLGYHVVGSPHQAGTKLSATDKCSIRILELQEILAASESILAVAETSNPYKITQLTRINIPIDDTNEAQESMSKSSVLASYDIVAVQPQSERAFSFACTSLDADIISLDLSKRLSYRFKSDLVKKALSRGIHFEILYGPLIREPGSRRQIFANAQALARETRGKGIVLSSGARTAIELRGPYDVVNLGTFLGLSEAQAFEAVHKNPTAVVQHALRRKSFRGILSIRAFQSGPDDGLLMVNTAEAMETDA